jgi:HEAT repeat protein
MSEQLERIRKDMENSDPNIRQLAVKNLLKIRHPNSFPILIKASKDPDADVRMYAASVLGTTDDRSAVPILLVLLRDPDPSVRISAAKALRDCREEMAFPRLVAAVDDSDPKVRATAITTLKSYCIVDAVEKLYNKLQDPEIGVRRASADALTACSGKIQPERIICGLDDPDPSVRHDIAVALGLTKNLNIGSALRALLEKENDSYVLEGVIEAIGALNDKESAHSLTKYLDVDHETELRQLSVRVLGDLGVPSIIDSLLPFIDDEDEDFQAEVLDTIDKLATPSALPALERLLEDEDQNEEISERLENLVEKLRSQIPASILQEHAQEKEQPHSEREKEINNWLQLLNSKDSVVRIQASRALAKTQPAPLKELYAILHTNEPIAKAYAAETIGLIKNPESASVLKEFLLEIDPTVHAFMNWAYYQCAGIPETSPKDRRDHHSSPRKNMHSSNPKNQHSHRPPPHHPHPHQPRNPQ